MENAAPKPEPRPCATDNCTNSVEPFLIFDNWRQPDHCKDCQQKVREETERREADEARKRRHKAIGLSPRFADRTFANFTESIQPTATNVAREYVEAFKSDTSSGLYLHGKAGSGKTHLVAAIANALMDKIRIKFITAPELLLQIKKQFRSDSIGNTDYLDTLSDAGLLIIDDLGSEKPTEWVQETLFVLLDRRYTQLKPTIITSNHNLQVIAERLGARTASRIVEMCEVVEMKPTDYRLQRSKN